jgi:hypothetical protein
MKTVNRAVLVVVGAGLALATTAPALAHEGRTVGDYALVVGFADEPVFAGTKNGVDLAVAEVGSGDPVVKGVDLEVEVQFGSESTTFPIEPEFVVGSFGEPGTYGAAFFPTRPGQYTFRFTGTIGNQEIDETFTSGPDTFSHVADPKEVSFPVQDPSTGELAERLDREVPRLTSAVENASDTADRNETLTIVALAAAGLALIVALVAVTRGRRTA